MPLEILTIPCRSDNYAFLLHESSSGTTALVDAPEAAPIEAALEQRGWSLDMILITHHHTDHVEAIEPLRKRDGAKVVGAKSDAHRLPPLDVALSEGDTVSVGGHEATVIDVSGHTVGHIAFHFADDHAVFTADSLMALGCGRVFEGTKPQMWASLCKLSALPDDTIVYSGHEYTESNARFAITIEPDNTALQARAATVSQARAKGEPTVPSRLGDEKMTNPFLRAHLSEVKAALGMENAPDDEVFAEIRTRKDNF